MIRRSIVCRALALILTSFSPACGSTGSDGTNATAGGTVLNATEATVDGAERRPAKMLRLTIRLDPAGPVLLNSTNAPNAVNRRDPHENSNAFFRSLDESGAVLCERGFVLPDTVRAEKPDAEGNLSGAIIQVDAPVISIAVPLYAGTCKIQLFSREGRGSEQDHILLGEIDP